MTQPRITTPTRRTGRPAATAPRGSILRAALSLLVLSGLLVGVPWLLIAAVGWPLPHHLPTAAGASQWLRVRVDTELFVNALAVATWIAWARLAAAVAWAIPAETTAIRHPDQARARRGLVQAGVGVLIAAILTVLLHTRAAPAPATANATAPGPATARPAAVTLVVEHHTPDIRPAAVDASDAAPLPASGQSLTLGNGRPGATGTVLTVADLDDDIPHWARRAAQDGHPLYRVEHGDTLWDIAEDRLGEPERWRQIWVASRFQPQPGGGQLVDADEIRAGWYLVLPTTAAPAAPAPPDDSHTPTPASPTAPNAPGPNSQAPSASAPPSTPVTPSDPTASSPATSEAAPSAEPSTAPTQPAPTQPSATTEPGSTAPTSGPQTPPTPDATTHPARSGADHGVELPGGWVTAGLAAALAAASAWVWRRRRARYQPERLPGPDPSARDLRPLPQVIGALRDGARTVDPGLLEPRDPGPTVAQAATEGAALVLPPPGPSGPELAGLGTPINPAGIGLTGPGAHAAARALLVAALSTGGPQDPDAAGTVLIPTATLAALLGAAAVDLGDIPRLQATPALPDALTALEVALLSRRREMDDHDVLDLPGLQAVTTPYTPPMPLLLLIAEAPSPALHARITATLALGAPLRIAAIILGDWPTGDTLHLHTDGTTAPTTAGNTTGDSGTAPSRMSVLDIPTTMALLGVLAEAHTGTPPPPAATATAPEAAPEAATPPGTGSETVSAAGPVSTPAWAQSPTPLAAEPEDPTAAETTEPEGPAAKASASAPAEEETVAATASVYALGGAPRLTSPTGEPITGFRTNALQLLALLVAHRAGMDLTDIMEAIHPDTRVTRAGEQLSTNVANLRNRIRTALGTPKNTDLKPVLNTGGHYQLNPATVTVDWWTLQDTLAQATATTDPQQRLTLLRQAVDLWTGPLLEDTDYDWAEPPREYSRRVAITAHTQLAELLTESDPAQTAALLENACQIDPLNEELARLAMRAHARNSSTTALRMRLRMLTAALNDIDTEPDDTTVQLADDLLRSTSSHPLRAARPADPPSGDALPEQKPDGPPTPPTVTTAG